MKTEIMYTSQSQSHHSPKTRFFTHPPSRTFPPRLIESDKPVGHTTPHTHRATAHVQHMNSDEVTESVCPSVALVAYCLTRALYYFTCSDSHGPNFKEQFNLPPLSPPALANITLSKLRALSLSLSHTKLRDRESGAHPATLKNKPHAHESQLWQHAL